MSVSTSMRRGWYSWANWTQRSREDDVSRSRTMTRNSSSKEDLQGIPSPEEPTSPGVNFSRRHASIDTASSTRPTEPDEIEGSVDASPTESTYKHLRSPTRMMSAKLGAMAASISKKRSGKPGEEFLDRFPFLKKYNLDVSHKLMGQTIAHLAAQQGDVPALIGLRGIPAYEKVFEKKDCVGWTPFHYACAGLHADAMDITWPFAELLVEKSDRMWIIHLAAREGRRDVFEKLASFGWRLDVANHHGERTMDVVQRSIRRQVGAMIRAQNGGKIPPRRQRKDVAGTFVRLIAKHNGVEIDDGDDS